MRGTRLLLHVASGFSRPLRQPGVRGGLQSVVDAQAWASVIDSRVAKGDWLEGGTNGARGFLSLSSWQARVSQQRRSVFGIGEESGDISKQFQERKLIGYSPAQMYSVVAGVEHYKEFVPWCQKSTIIGSRPPNYVKAELEVGFKLFLERYTSQVYLHPPNKVVSHVDDSSLFDHLDSTWEFKPGPVPGSTWLTFHVDFAFKSPLYRQVACLFFDEVVKRMMGAFESRCQQVYGPSVLARKPAAAAAPAPGGAQKGSLRGQPIPA